MMPPPFQADPYDLLPPGQSNPGHYGVLIAWDATRTLCGPVIGDAVARLQFLMYPPGGGPGLVLA